MALDRLRALPLDGIKLHGSDDPALLRTDPDEQKPVLLRIRTVVDDLATVERRMPIEHLHGRGVALHGPMINGRVRDQSQGVQGDPLPEDDVVRHGVSLHLGLHFDVEDLEGFLRLDSRFALEGDDLRRRVHDGALGGDGPPDRVGRVRHVDDDHLGSVAHFFPHADELVTLHGESGEGNVGDVDSDIAELRGEFHCFISKRLKAFPTLKQYTLSLKGIKNRISEFPFRKVD